MNSRAERPRGVLALSARERWITGIAVVATLALVAAGYLAVRLAVETPEHRDASARTVATPTITASVRSEHREERVRLRGAVTYPDRLSVAAPAQRGDAPAVLVALNVTAGDEVAPGSVLADVSGHPLIALPGPFPLYRDLRPGMTGQDVEALQRALSASGQYRGDVDGAMGPGTFTAVRALLKDKGLSGELLTDPEQAPEAAKEPETPENGAPTAPGGARGLDSQTKLVVPRDLFVMVPRLPATVLKTPHRVGAEVPDGEAILELSASAPVVTADISTVQAVDIHEGLPVEITIGGQSTTGRLAGIAEKPDADGLSVVTVTTEKALDRTLVGQDAEVGVIIRQTEGEVPTVPVGAIRSDSRGGTYVLVPSAADTPRRVDVDVHDVVDGAAVIASTRDLPDGTDVIVGTESRRGGAGVRSVGDGAAQGDGAESPGNSDAPGRGGSEPSDGAGR